MVWNCIAQYICMIVSSTVSPVSPNISNPLTASQSRSQLTSQSTPTSFSSITIQFISIQWVVADFSKVQTFGDNNANCCVNKSFWLLLFPSIVIQINKNSHYYIDYQVLNVHKSNQNAENSFNALVKANFVVNTEIMK